MASTGGSLAMSPRDVAAVSTPVYAIAYRPDGKLVATAGFDETVRLSDPMSGKLVQEFVPVPGKK